MHARSALPRYPLATLAVAIFFSAFFGTGCSPRWVVVREAAPNPFNASSAFNVDKLDFTGLRVGEKSEAEYLGGKDAEQQASFQGDKSGMTEAFMNGFDEAKESIRVAAPGAGVYVVKPHITFIEPGFYVGVASGATQVDVTVEIFDDKQALLDQITIISRIPASMTNPSSGGRLRDAARDLGRVTAKYVLMRTGLD